MLENRAIQITPVIPSQYQYISDCVFILLILILTWAIYKFIVNRQQVGNILIKLPIRGQGIVIFAYIILIINIIFPFFDIEKLFNYPIENLTRLMFSIYLSLRLLMNNPPSIRDKGILTAGGLAKWRKIYYYKWITNTMKPNEHILIISTGTFFWNIWRLTIHNKQKNNVDSLLQEYLVFDK
ncbi:MAG: hypothetical protein EAZ76_07895 [Nostocales cyanobacterium]|nr:MAG: hypothetical protein EAZ87_20350 [Nostocales cyanobacterium]TAF16150.1 MAG: hypothetical protein EAZ76_07895 [Nostocales cyanobacterium]